MTELTNRVRRQFQEYCASDPALATADGPCVLWTGAKGYQKGRPDKAYGVWRQPKDAFHSQLTRSGIVKAHRAAFLLYRGFVPSSLEIDHICRTKLCVNPWHLKVRGKREHAIKSNQDRRNSNGSDKPDASSD